MSNAQYSYKNKLFWINKRIFDIIFSSVLIVLLFPLMSLIFFLVWIFIGFPLFFQKMDFCIIMDKKMESRKLNPDQ